VDDSRANSPTSAAAEAQGDDGCLVDWSWLRGLEIVGATSTLDQLVLRLGNGETLTVRAALWKAKPFLAFDPWKPR
jgi:hypothetical protein